MPLFLSLVLGFCLFIGFNLTNAKSINDALNEAVNPQKASCIFTQNAEMQITNKISGHTEQIEFEVGRFQNYEALAIKPTKCCKIEDLESYAFLDITSKKKQVFKGWMFSKHSSLNSIEDQKFDVILLNCF
jgi:hypothetical protein